MGPAVMVNINQPSTHDGPSAVNPTDHDGTLTEVQERQREYDGRVYRALCICAFVFLPASMASLFTLR
jgi:hypothetical protein